MKKNKLPDQFGIRHYLAVGMIVDWVECYWKGDPAGGMIRDYYRGNIARLVWINGIPRIVLRDVKCFYPESGCWRTTKICFVKNRFDFVRLAKAKILVGFDRLPANRLRFNIHDNVTGIVEATTTSQNQHAFTVVVQEEFL